jgi:alpha-L-fucosidase
VTGATGGESKGCPFFYGLRDLWHGDGGWGNAVGVTYVATWDSVSSHPTPRWYEDAKLGVFLHWGLYSVPAWAPQVPDISTLLRQHRPSWLMRHNPYAEWYANTVRLAGSPTQRHHEQTYGRGFGYDGFRTEFEQASAGADLEGLASLCREAGARYVVLTTKHHEGYCLWPTSHPHPVKGRYHSSRDLVGDLSRAVTAQDMRMGLYYSGGYDWPYSGAVLSNLGDLLLGVPPDAGYARYAEAHVLELIERYHPSILWNDIGWPTASHVPALLAAYYNAVDDGVVNDRWFQGRRSGVLDLVVRAGSTVVEGLWPVIPASAKKVAVVSGRHADFSTLEYSGPDRAQTGKWEATRGVGHSFGANHNEAAEDVLTTEELVRFFVDVVAKNGNLLIGVGPRPDGRVPDWQAEPLLGLGRWLSANGEAVYGTRPWTVTSGSTSDGTPVRFTSSEEALYATLLGKPRSNEFTLRGVRVVPSGREGDERRDGLGYGGSEFDARVLGEEGGRAWVANDGLITVDLGATVADSPAHVVRMSPRWVFRPDDLMDSE